MKKARMLTAFLLVTSTIVVNYVMVWEPISQVMYEEHTARGKRYLTKELESIPVSPWRERFKVLHSFGVPRPRAMGIINRGVRMASNFGYTITTDVCAGSSILMLIYVHSAAQNFRQRATIRDTWGNVTWYRQHMYLDIRVLFVVALPGGKYTEVQPRLLEEAGRHGDLLQENYPDAYHRLTYKAVGALRWITKHCAHVPFIMKTDDDVFVNMPMMLQRITKVQLGYKTHPKKPHRWLTCRVWKNHFVDREGKWKVPMEMLAARKYPLYCQGAMYAMTFNVARALSVASYNVPYLWVDDAYITGIVRATLGMSMAPLSSNPRLNGKRTGKYKKVKPRTADAFLSDVMTGEWDSGCVVGYQPKFYQTLWNVTSQLMAISMPINTSVGLHIKYNPRQIIPMNKNKFAEQFITIKEPPTT